MIEKRYLSLIWFLLGFGLFMFTRASRIVPTIPVTILIAPVFILRFNRTLPPTRGNLLTLLGFLLSFNIGLWGLFDMEAGLFALAFSLIRSSLLAVLYFLPYLLDRMLYSGLKTKGAFSTLIFPLVTTAVFYLSSLEGPFDGAIQSSKFVYGPLLVQQALSLFGLWSFIFITSWFASLVNYAWEKGFTRGRNWKPAIAFVACLAAVLAFGAVRLSSAGSERETVRIAAVILPVEAGETVPMEEFWKERLVSPFEEGISRIEEATSKAASQGAKIVTFQELLMSIGEEDEERLRGEYRRIAEEQGVYLSVTYGYYAGEGKGENKHLLIDDGGEIRCDYTKRYLVGIGDLGEAGVYRKGAEIIQSAETPYGRIGISICRDMEFVKYIRQAGRAGVDIMLSPSYEWPRSTSLIPSPVYMRAIENGFSFLRPTYHGVTFAVDYAGNILAKMRSDSDIMYAEVPTRGTATLYTRVGDLLGWICLLGLAGLIVLHVARAIRRKMRGA